MPKILVKTGEKQGEVYNFSGEEVTLGRDLANTIVLPDRRISRRHIRIFPQENDYIIEDVGSVNGTMVNGLSITKQELHIGDEIEMGSTKVCFLSTSDSEEALLQGKSSQVRLSDDHDAHQTMKVELKMDSSSIESLGSELEKSDIETIQKAYKRLMTLYSISHDLGLFVELPKLLDRILELVLDILKADRGFIMFIEENAGELKLQAIKEKKGLEESGEISFSRTIANQVIQSGESILTSDASADDRFKKSESIVMHGIRSTMCVPIRVKEKVLGIMNVDTKGKVVSFTQDDLELLTAISNQAAVAIDNAKLFESLKKANEDLKQQQTQLIEAEKLSALGQLAGGVAHEINNPMTSILGYSELSAKRLSEGKTNPDEIKECVEFMNIVETEARRCQQIVKSLLQFARRKKGDMDPVDVNNVIEASLTIAQFNIKGARIEIKKELSDNLPQILGDGNQLQQVFLNMIINAKDAMEDGGSLTISSSQSDDQWVVVSFKDTGCGIPEDKMDEIFKPLYTSKDEGKGTGLGLSISRDIVERHNGAIDVQSTMGEGTSFIIKLPILKQQ